MATEEDVRVGSVWRWVSQPGIFPVPVGAGSEFKITHAYAEYATYHYKNGHGPNSRPISQIVAHAELVTPAPELPIAPGSRMRFKAGYAAGAFMAGVPFRVVYTCNVSGVVSDVYFRFEYAPPDSAPLTCTIGYFRRWAEPVPPEPEPAVEAPPPPAPGECIEAPRRCAPDCTPATPCMRVFRVDGPLWEAGRACPEYREVMVTGSAWAAKQRGWRKLVDVAFFQHAPSPAPELRCDRELACGLYRGTR